MFSVTMASATSDSTRLSKMIKDSVVLLCQNALTFTSELHVQALLAISVDRSTIFAVQIDEKIAKTGVSVSGVSSGTSSTQGKVLAEQQHPPAARRLALPASSVSSPASSSMAWPLHSPQAAAPPRTRGPRFPVGRGRGVMQGGRGRGGATMRGGMAPVRMIRTAVSSVRFPASRPRTQAPRGVGRPVGVRLALPPAGGTPHPAGSTAIVRQRAPAAVRQVLSSVVAQRSASQAQMRKPSPRLAIMPPSAQSSTRVTAPGMRQRAVSPRQAGVATAPRGAGRLRLAIMPAPQQMSATRVQSPAGVRQQSSSMVSGQAGAARMVTSPQGAGRPRLAIMPSARQYALANAQSPLGARQQSPRQAGLVQAGASPQGMARARLVPVSRSQPSVLQSPTQPRAAPPPSSTRLARMPPPQFTVQSPSAARQQAPTTSPTKYQLKFVSQQPSPVKHTTQAAASVVPASILPPARLALEAPQHPMIAVHLSNAGATAAVGTAQSPRTPSRPVRNVAELTNLLLSPSRSSAMPSHMAVTQQQRVAVTSAVTAAMSLQPVAHPASMSQTSLTHPSEMMEAVFLSSPQVHFSPGRLQPAASQQLTAVPLYAGPTQAASTVPPSPTQRTDPPSTPSHSHGILPGDVFVPGSPYGDSRSVQLMQLAGTPTKPLPMPHAAANFLQQQLMSQFSPHRQPPSPASQAYSVSLFLTDDVSRSPQRSMLPQESPRTPVASQQQHGHSSLQGSALPQSQISATYVNQNQQVPSVPSLVPIQAPAASVQQRVQNQAQVPSPAHVQVSHGTMQQKMSPATALQQFVIRPRHVMRPEPGHQLVSQAAAVASSSRQVAAGGGLEKNQMDMLEIIKQQACEQLRQAAGSRTSQQVVNAPQQAVSANITQEIMMHASDHRQQMSSVASTGIPGQVTLMSKTPVSAVQTFNHAGQVSSELRGGPPALVPVTVTHPTAPASQHLPAVTQQGGQQPAIASSSNGFKSSTPGVPGQMDSGTQPPQTSVASRPMSRSSSASDASISIISWASDPTEQNLASIGASSSHNTLLNKEKLLQLREKVRKTESVELDKQKIISSQLRQLQGDAAPTEVADDIELYSSDTDPAATPAVAKSSVSSTSVGRRSEQGLYVLMSC